MDFSIENTDIATKPKITSEKHEAVVSFFNSDNISWQLPGRKDYVTVLKNGKKAKVQKKVMLSTVNEAFQEFKQENPDLKIGKSTFAALRPAHVVPISDKDHSVCCCKCHENFELLCQGLRAVKRDLPDTKGLIRLTVCDPDSVQCHLGNCKTCCNIENMVSSLFVDSDEETCCTILQWNDRNKKEKLEIPMSAAEVELTRQLRILRKHSFIAKTQLYQKNHLRDSLEYGEIILHEDFLENYALKHQNEIMSAHWDQSTTTIFTAVVSTQEGSRSYAVVSDELYHDKFSVAAFYTAILDHAASSGIGIGNVHFFSDGAGGQFKNCFTLSTVVSPKLLHADVHRADWSFFATAHGKGPVAGVGGTVKRAVWRRVLQGKAVVNSSKDFSAVAAAVCPNITVLHVDSATVSAVRKELSALWSDQPPQTIPDTRSFHYVRSTSATELAAFPISPFIPAYVVDSKKFVLFKRKQNPTQTGQSVHMDSESASEDTASDQPMSDHLDSSDMRGVDECCSDMDHEQISSEHMSQFTSFLSKRNFRLRGETPGDGNCFFWALKSQLERTNLAALEPDELRKRICDYLEFDLTADEKEQLGAFLPDIELENYVSDLRRNGTYADHITVEYMSRMLSGQPMTIVREPFDIVFGNPATQRPMLYLGYISSMQHYVSVEPVPDTDTGSCGVSIEVEHYYAVDYVDRFYIGRVLSRGQNPGFFNMKFLHQTSKGGKTYFSWPKTDDCDEVFHRNIFFGPLQLQGCGEYTINHLTDIQGKFASLKSHNY